MDPQRFVARADDRGRRLDVFLVEQLGDVSRARVQELIRQEKVRVEGASARASLRLRGGEAVEVVAPAQREPLRAVAEDIPLDVVYEDEDVAVVNKPAGMMVHAGAGRTEDARRRGTLVNALLHRFGRLSRAGGELRPGIVHRLDKETSGLVVVAKNDRAHHGLARQFAARTVKKTYIALVHGWMKADAGTVRKAIRRDPVRRTRMATTARGGREAVTHYRVLERIDSPLGRFSRLEVKIDTGRTHQIRVHLASLGHPVAGDTLYGAPRGLRERRPEKVGKRREPRTAEALLSIAGDGVRLARNFLHAAALEFLQPRTGSVVSLRAPLPPELRSFLALLKRGRRTGMKL